MQVQQESVFISLVVITILTLTWRVLNWVWLKPKQLERFLKKQGLKGNTYKLLFGDSKEIISMMKEARSKPMDAFSDNYDILPRVLPLHGQCLSLHGRNYFQWIGPTPRLTITDPRLIKEIILNHQVFRKAITNPLAKLLVTGLISYEGEKWARHRNLLNPAFHLDKLKQMVPAMYLSCIEMIRRWETLVSTDGSCEVDVWPHICNLSGDVISRTAFGSNYEEGKQIFKLQSIQCDNFLRCMHSPYVPGWRFLPTERNKAMKRIYKEVRTILTKIINKRQQSKEGDDGGNDLLGILLNTNFKEQGNKKMDMLTTEEVIEECKLFYLAGAETSSALLVWTMILLSKHQKWQALAREEVQAVFGGNKPDFDGLNHLKTMSMILNEVLRLYSPVTGFPRRVHKETRLGELILPQGIEIYVPTMAIHRDRELWGEDALEFNPQRFSEGILKATNGQTIFFPFGAGPRICIGQNFAMVEMKLVLATILRHFSLQLSPSYVHAPCRVLAVQPQHGARLILQKI